MKVVVGSTKKPKLSAVESTFKAAFPGQEIVIEGVSVDSGVSAHPTSSEESILGAENRVAHAKKLVRDADYYVGIEGGFLRPSGRVWEIGWVVVSDANGNSATGTTAGLELRGKILQAITDGVELTEVIAKEFGIESIGSKNGFYGLATNDMVTRQASCEQGVAFALAPFLHPEFYTD